MNSPFLPHNANNFSNYSDAPKGDDQYNEPLSLTDIENVEGYMKTQLGSR